MAITSTLVLATTATNIFTASGDQAITTVIFCNTSTSACTLDVFLVPAGQAAASQYTVLKSLTLPSTETFVLDSEKLILANGDSIQAQETSNNNHATVATVSSVSI
jgi:hypothetical protein